MLLCRRASLIGGVYKCCSEQASTAAFTQRLPFSPLPTVRFQLLLLAILHLVSLIRREFSLADIRLFIISQLSAILVSGAS